MVHPIEAKDAARKYPWLRYLPDGMIEAYMRRKSPVIASHITGIQSLTGETAEGWFIGLPMTPRMLTSPELLQFSYEQIGKCCELAHGLGAELIGLGAFSSVVGDGGITIAKNAPLPVTTGNSYTVATAIEAAELAASQLGINLADAVLGVVGASGSIGKTCATILAPKMARTVLIGRDLVRTEQVAQSLPRASASIDPNDLLPCDVVVTVSSAGGALVFPQHLGPGAVVVDVARPRDVSVRVARERPDVLVIEGGVVSVPGDVEFNFEFGFPAKTAYACMSETMLLALEGRIESFSLGKEISVEQVLTTQELAAKHGFKLAGFRSFEREVGPELIERTRQARLSRRVQVGVS